MTTTATPHSSTHSTDGEGRQRPAGAPRRPHRPARRPPGAAGLRGLGHRSSPPATLPRRGVPRHPTTPRVVDRLIETGHQWGPLVLLALAFTIPLAAGKYNIGGEGQLLVGATASAAVGITMKISPMVVLLPLVLLVGVLAGGVYASIAAWLMDRFGVNEILDTVLLNFVSFGIVDYVASEVWMPAAGTRPRADRRRRPAAPGRDAADAHPRGAAPAGLRRRSSSCAARARLCAGRRHHPRAAQVDGVRIGRVAVGSLVVGGALAGFAGAIQVAGVQADPGHAVQLPAARHHHRPHRAGQRSCGALRRVRHRGARGRLQRHAAHRRRAERDGAHRRGPDPAVPALLRRRRGPPEEVLAIYEVVPFLQLVVTAMVPSTSPPRARCSLAVLGCSTSPRRA